MKQLISIVGLYVLLIMCTVGWRTVSAQEFIIKTSENSYAKTLQKLKAEIKSQDMELIQHINHTEAADKVGLDLLPTAVIIFGNPKAGTILMQEDPRVAIELPLRILIWKENEITYLGFQDPIRLLQMYNIETQIDILDNMRQALDLVTNAAIH
ncbi:DUF302 domain-containing protein [Anditalea andensis]|uniref:DUF302 domain-containing protein n=1 Tax=Anditalea andensis TaxID=1048983 RepID=A0A074L2W1_9BACT|nr:DUF302 domain-containing protein [Anditalea andensis]KEO75524.1 hypothetical protein EL17_01360 [Anditalea andensis]